MLATSLEDGQILRPRSVADVKHIDVYALSDAWSAARKFGRRHLGAEAIQALRETEQTADFLASLDFEQVREGHLAIILEEQLLTREDLDYSDIWVRQRLFANIFARMLNDETPVKDIPHNFRLAKRPIPLLEVARIRKMTEHIAPAQTRLEPSLTKTLDPCDAESWAAHGNQLFAEALFDGAASAYGAALRHLQENAAFGMQQESQMSTCLRGRAKCFKQIQDYTGQLADANSLLGLDDADLEAHELRMLALEGLELFGEALVEARLMLLQNPKHLLANRKQHEFGKICRHDAAMLKPVPPGGCFTRACAH